jgi:hypothetical protein
MDYYSGRILRYVLELLRSEKGFERALDFGAGDGRFASALRTHGIAKTVVAIDVKKQKRERFPVTLYDGKRIPFAPRSFDLVYAIDALHHCGTPVQSLREMLACCASHVLIKDHFHDNVFAKAALAALDLRGNLPKGIPSPFHYQRGWEWATEIERSGFRRERLIHPALCNRGVVGFLTNGLQFIGLWRRE